MPRFRQRKLITWDVGGKTEIPTVREIISISRFFKDESSITLNKGSYINQIRVQQPDSIREVIVTNLFLIQIKDQRMYGNLARLIYFCDKNHPISAQSIFVNCLFLAHLINTKKIVQNLVIYWAKNYDYLILLLKSTTQNQFGLN